MLKILGFLASVAFFSLVGWVLWKIDSDCVAKGGVSVRGALNYSCVKAEPIK